MKKSGSPESFGYHTINLFKMMFPRGEFSDICLFLLVFSLIPVLWWIDAKDLAKVTAGSLTGGVFTYIKNRRGPGSGSTPYNRLEEEPCDTEK